MLPARERVALCRHDGVPRWVQVALPLAMLGCMCLFLVASSTPGVIVTIGATAGGQQILTPAMANLSIDNCLRQMWRMHSYPIAIVLATFSLFWPFAKLMVLLHAWLCPYPEEVRGICCAPRLFMRFSLEA